MAILGSAFRSVAARFLKLPRKKNGIRVERNVEMRTRDGVILIADRYFPKDGKPRPTVLVRSPYGRGFLLAFSAALLAERGLTVVVQSVRATDGSGGVFDPVRQERADGADAVHWVRDQPWFGGKLYLFGGSYLAGCGKRRRSGHRRSAFEGGGLVCRSFQGEIRRYRPRWRGRGDVSDTIR
ncbi:CocE/NonD family hydrolase, partial [Novosphingobium resinovorum]|uniref:CocE/NonD family hydrolase n=1 Tax=Novosphingobium resinovorum TaxID=158500 RepID=UPI00055C5D4D